MALVAVEERYERGNTGIGLVRGLNWSLRRGELEQAGEWRLSRDRAREAARSRTRQREQAAGRHRVPVLGMLSAAMVACVAVLLLMGYIELTRLSSETVSLKSELKTLESEHVTLSARYESMFDLASVQEAAEAAGMTKPSGSQVGYMDLSEGDNVVVYREEQPKFFSHLLLSAQGGFEALREFFD